MTPDLERAIKAQFDARYGNEPEAWREKMWPTVKDAMCREFCVGLQALREPSEEVIHEAWQQTMYATEEDVKAAWQAAIDRILK